jgi:uncharacterized membrane protein YeaQ/YmgE (transglycosylase-associated protein family)
MGMLMNTVLGIIGAANGSDKRFGMTVDGD